MLITLKMSLSELIQFDCYCFYFFLLVSLLFSHSLSLVIPKLLGVIASPVVAFFSVSIHHHPAHTHTITQQGREKSEESCFLILSAVS